jgi:predicted transcriptional regulator YdeE
MEPKIFARETLLIAGVTGSGDETRKAWEAFEKLDKINPLKNKVSEEGYEIRMYPGGQGPGEVHVGMQVSDARVPKEYKVFSLPASLYAEFVIYPSKGWESSNAEMNKWLSENAEKYKQGYIDDKAYAIELYDERFKGTNNPESEVPILVPIVPIK